MTGTKTISNLSIIILVALALSSCTSSGRLRDDRIAKLAGWERDLDSLESVRTDLQEELKASVSYIESAEVHQVLRSREEKARQLYNLNLYQDEIKAKLDSVENFITLYTDSIRVNGPEL